MDSASFQHHYSVDETEAGESQQLECISICFRWITWQGFQSVCLHYQVSASQLLVFVRESQTFPSESLTDILHLHAERLCRQPMAIVGILLEANCNTLLSDIQRCNSGIYTMELSLGVTAESHRLQELGYSKSGRNLDEENRVLYSIQNRLAASSRGCGDLTIICQQYMTFVKELKKQAGYEISLEDVQAALSRLDFANPFLGYLERMTQTQFTVLYNLLLREDTKVSIRLAETSKRIAEAAQKDSSSMKTVAYLTLAFLPATFVSAVFSTTVFDLQNWKSGSNQQLRVVSAGWWVYAVVCLLATGVTASVYYFWNRDQDKALREKGMDEEKRPAERPRVDLRNESTIRPLAEDIKFLDGSETKH